MLRFPQFFITLPLLAQPFSGFVHAAQAEAVMGQLKRRVADGKCKILPAAYTKLARN